MPQDTIASSDTIGTALLTKTNNDFSEYFLTQAEVIAARKSAPTLLDQINLIISDAAATTYYFAWASLTGALAKPASVSHNGLLWGLLNNLADVTTSEPGVTADWEEITSDRWANKIFKGDWSALTGALLYPAFVAHDRRIWALNTDLADVTAKTPGVDSEWEEMTPYLYELLQALGSITTNTEIDLADGTIVSLTVAGDFTLSITGWFETGKYSELLLIMTNGDAHIVTWPTINWLLSTGAFTTTFSENEAALQASGIDFVFLWTINGGTTVYGKIVR